MQFLSDRVKVVSRAWSSWNFCLNFAYHKNELLWVKNGMKKKKNRERGWREHTISSIVEVEKMPCEWSAR